ncbi:hypothetical protein FOL47_004470, partial [Perkinsus chesapeaki]
SQGISGERSGLATGDISANSYGALAARLSLIETTLEKLANGMDDLRRAKRHDQEGPAVHQSELRSGETDSPSISSLNSPPIRPLHSPLDSYKPWQLGRNMCRLMRRYNSGKIGHLSAEAVAEHLRRPLPATWENGPNYGGSENPKLLRQAGKVPHPALRNLRSPSYLAAAKLKKNRPVELKEIEALKSPTTPDCSRFLRLWIRLTEGQRHSARSLYSGLCDVSIDYIEPIVGAYRNDAVVRILLGFIDDTSAEGSEETFF